MTTGFARRVLSDFGGTKPRGSTGPCATPQTEAAHAIYAALRATPALSQPSGERDELWLVIWDHVTTRHECWVAPMGSGSPVRISEADADAELIAAWEWLEANEAKARGLDADDLYRVVRGVATRSAHGSARAAQSNRLGGLTAVPANARIRIAGDVELERVSA